MSYQSSDEDIARERGRLRLIPKMERACEDRLQHMAKLGQFSLELHVECQFQALPLRIRIMHGKSPVWVIEGDLAANDPTKFIMSGWAP